MCTIGNNAREQRRTVGPFVSAWSLRAVIASFGRVCVHEHEAATALEAQGVTQSLAFAAGLLFPTITPIVAGVDIP